MQLLNDCLTLHVKINEYKEKIEDIESKLSSPKNQIISDMPRGGGSGGSITDKLIDKKWAYQEKKYSFEAELNFKWSEIHRALESIGATMQEITLFELRFREGLNWTTSNPKTPDCLKLMRKHYGEGWNENRIFRTYRTILDKLNKTE